MLEMVKKFYIHVKILSKCCILGNTTFWLKSCTIQVHNMCGAQVFYPNEINTLLYMCILPQGKFVS
jgi:hypothetical protein